MEIAIVIFVIAVIFIAQSIKVVPQQNAWVKERLGKYAGTLTPGLNFLLPFIDRVAYKHSLKEIPLDVPSQVCITRDNVEIFDGIARAFGAKPVIGAFHSLSAVAAAMATLRFGPRWSPLVLFDPPIFPREGHPLEAMEHGHMRDMSALARRRPERYPDTAAFAAQLASRAGFRRWVPGAHDLFARSTLRPDPGGNGWVLRCPRELEARIFEQNVDPTVWPRLGACPVPLFLIGADTRVEGQQAPAFLTEGLAADQGIPYAMIPDTTHFLQIERPRAVLREMGNFLARQGITAAAQAPSRSVEIGRTGE